MHELFPKCGYCKCVISLESCPFSLSGCVHTLCNRCVFKSSLTKRCPICLIKFGNYQLNVSLLGNYKFYKNIYC